MRDGPLWRIWSQLPWSKLHRILASSFLSSSYRVICVRRWTDGRTEWNQYTPQQLHCIIKIPSYHGNSHYGDKTIVQLPLTIASSPQWDFLYWQDNFFISGPERRHAVWQTGTVALHEPVPWVVWGHDNCFILQLMTYSGWLLALHTQSWHKT